MSPGPSDKSRYPPIGDYGYIADCHYLSLIAAAVALADLERNKGS